jgi:glycosyltransferase involved in cell wall biosynthesis
MEYRDPYISVILPTYNREQTLLRAICSVLEQTFENFELIVVDDGSTDETPALIRRITDRRLIYIQHSQNSGVSAARNSAIQTSRGKLLAFQDSDDAWDSQKLERQIEKMRVSDWPLGVVYAPFLRHDPYSIKLYPNPDELADGDIHANLLFKNLVSAQLALVKRECFENSGLFDGDLPCLVDWELWLRISKTYHFAYVNQPLAQVYFTSNSISLDRNNLAHALEMIIQKHRNDFQLYPEALALHQYESGVLLCLSGEFRRGQERLIRVAKDNPGKPYYWLAVSVSLLGETIFRRIYEFRNRFIPGAVRITTNVPLVLN